MLPVLPSANGHPVHLDNNNTQRNTSKRTPSMIFRIEHLLPATTLAPLISNSPMSALRATASTYSSSSSCSSRGHVTPPHAVHGHTNTHAPSKRTKLLRSGVHVSQFTPKDTVSESISTLALMSLSGNNCATEQQECTRAYCSLSQGVLDMTPPLLRKVKLSEDIHSYNALFELENSCVRLRVVRDIAKDDEVVAWYGEETTLLMSIPFLTPLNIQGNNRYTCHLCHLTFETPNPLKIHLALGCGRHSMDILYIRLHYAVTATNYHSQLLPAAIPAQLYALSANPAGPAAATISPNASPQTQPHTQTLPHRFSAFKPITSTAGLISATEATTSLHTTTKAGTPSSALSFMPSISTATLPPMSLLQPPSANALNAAAQIEAIVSNMGASKQGHLCIYCGKVYSRKYGLKIHIRTHTGFKPLKCKFCLRPFGDPSNLNKHVRLHIQSSASSSGAEGYKCNLCHKTLARRRDLQRHIESRHASTTPAPTALAP